MIKFDDFSIEKGTRFKILNSINKILNLKNQDYHNQYINNLELEIAKKLNYNYIIGTNSGTSSLQLALIANDIKTGDEVIIPYYTYIATALSIINIGAVPILCKTKNDLTIDIEDIKSKITPQTKAIIPVHIHGNICNIQEIINICKKHKLHLIEDCSQSQGGKYFNSPTNNIENVGSYEVGCFSMHTSKICGGCGSSGLISCNSKEMLEKIKQLQDPNKCLTINQLSNRTPSKINAIQISIINERTNSIIETINHKKEIAQVYDKSISNKKIKKLTLNSDNYNTYRDYCIELENKDELMQLQDFLFKNNIETKNRNYNLQNNPQLLKLISAKSNIKDIKTRQILCLPCNKHISKEDAIAISNIINSF